MVKIPREEYDALIEELEILRNVDIMDSIRENEEAKAKGIKTWKLQTHK